MRNCWLIIISLLAADAAWAHEARPAYLEIRETAPGQFRMLWRTPVLAGMRLPLALKLPDGTRNLKEPSVQELADSILERRWIDAGPNGLAGKRIEFVGLQLTITEVLVRAELLDGRTWTIIAHPSQPWVEIAAPQTQWAVAGAYMRLGVEHILTGFDHLLYILSMLLLVKGWKRIIGVMTAFTLTHSLTLTAAALGWVHVPQKPVEACIALSILFVTSEIVRARQGFAGFTQKWPWVISFSFGLLHGFGFAGALSEVGLPDSAIPVALLCFNIGVEIGQLIFVAGVFAILFAGRELARRIDFPRPQWLWRVPPYAIGSIAAFWFIQRLSAF